MAQVFKMVYAGVSDRIELACQYRDIVEVTESDTYEVWTSDIRLLEDELAESRALTSDEHSPLEVTQEYVDNFKKAIGEEIYDMLLDGTADVALLVNM